MALCFCLLDIKFSHQEPMALVPNQVYYREAFDLIDHSILVRKLRNQCKLPASIINSGLYRFFIGQIPAD